MRRVHVAAGYALLAAVSLYAADPVFSGSSEAKARFAVDGNGDGGYAFEEFANLRFRTAVGERGSVQGAFNAIASSGSGKELTIDGEAERLYMSVRGEKIDAEAGLMRLAFGFGQGFRPTDLLARPNPLFPDARPKGVLGGLLAWYPSDRGKLQGFAVDSGKLNTGLSADIHSDAGSLQALYVAELPDPAGMKTVHRTGVSLKFDLGAGFTLDALYTSGTDLPEIAAGADYSFADGKVYLAGQYFFNGDAPSGGLSAAAPDEDGLYRRHYALGTVSWQYSDYTNFSAACTVSAGDGSAIPTLAVSHEPFQGLTVNLSGRMPFDSRTFGGGGSGEFGPDRMNERGSVTIGARMRF